jgi:tetratricopeptide (TPR) repeat protein
MRSKVQDVLTGLVALILLAAVGYGIYRWREDAGRTALARALAEASPRGGTPETIEGLKTAIAAYEDELARYVEYASRTGVYWKLLGSRLQDKGLHGEALEAFEQALHYTPGDPATLYLTGLSAGHVAKSALDVGGVGLNKAHYYAVAESAYLRAIELDGSYAQPRYGLAVLYVFELGRPEEAIPHLERYLEMRRSDTDGMFVLAQAYYMAGRREEAVDCYDRIIGVTRDKDVKAQAEANRYTVLSGQ